MDNGQMEEQQEHQPLHGGVVDGIARLTDPLPRYRDERHKLTVSGPRKPHVDRRSWEHLVDFVDNGDDTHHDVVITD
jgi:hypothetical protein